MCDAEPMFDVFRLLSHVNLLITPQRHSGRPTAAQKQ